MLRQNWTPTEEATLRELAGRGMYLRKNCTAAKTLGKQREEARPSPWRAGSANAAAGLQLRACVEGLAPDSGSLHLTISASAFGAASPCARVAATASPPVHKARPVLGPCPSSAGFRRCP